MKKSYDTILLLLLVGSSVLVSAQDYLSLPEFTLSEEEIASHIYFLASDELKGRRTGEEGNNIAARYIAEQFRSYGLKTPPGQESYFQPIEFEKRIVLKESSIETASGEIVGSACAMLNGDEMKVESRLVFAKNGWVDEEKGIDDYEDLDVYGKIVLVNVGVPGESSIRKVLSLSAKKRMLAEERGALALVELYRENFPWNYISRAITSGRMGVKDPTNLESILPHFWVNNQDQQAGKKLIDGENVTLKGGGILSSSLISNNVIGLIEGTNISKKQEYVVLTAHYDHIGVSKPSVAGGDSINNGARDNATGVAALLTAAKALAEERPERSILLIAFTAEEMGLLGSQYYVEHPLLPLDKMVFNLNSDGAGYTDTTLVAIMGYDRVGAKEEFDLACQRLGVTPFADPAPEQNLFDRSDNVSFARKGIPAPTMSPGFEAFTQELMQHYHSTSDEVASLNLSYIATFVRTYAHAARLIANKDKTPRWVEGDKYEGAAKELYELD
ncbi:MAG: M20/M25/M40 family metallo-hydrolase [Bacteroidota bacterium]